MLALITGEGALPAALCRELPEPPLICVLDGFFPDGLKADILFRIETLGSLLGTLKERGVTEVCFAGAIRRTPIDPAAIDAATLPLVPILQQALMSGDDGALRAVVGIFEQSGLSVRGAHQIAPSLLPPVGVPSAAQPDDGHRADARRGAAIVEAMAAVDVGQACVVRRGQALAVEGVYGTDWMLDSLRRRPEPREGGLLYKAPKPGQDRRVDLPMIGSATPDSAAAAGLDGVVIEAGGVMVLDLPEVLANCDRLGLFLWVRGPDG